MVPDEGRRLWCTLASDEDALHPATTTVVHGSRGIAPEGWTGVVRLGDAYLIEAGDADAAVLSLLRNLEDPNAILVPGAGLVDMGGTGSMEALGIGGWAMLAVGVAALIHGILLFTSVAAAMGGISEPLMLSWATVMVGNQVLVATVANWRWKARTW